MIKPSSDHVLARDVMVPTTKLITLRPNMDALTAVRMLVRHRISGAPVIDENHQYLGVFSEKTSMQFLIRLTYEKLPSSQVSSFMNADRERTISEDTDLLTIIDKFVMTPLRRLPVLSDDDQLLGQISRRDVLGTALRCLDPEPEDRSTGLYLSAILAADDDECPF